MLNNTHDRCDTVSNIFLPYFRDLLMKFWEIYQKCFNSVNFWARKMFFFLNGSEFRQKMNKEGYKNQGRNIHPCFFIITHLSRWLVEEPFSPLDFVLVYIHAIGRCFYTRCAAETKFWFIYYYGVQWFGSSFVKIINQQILIKTNVDI